MAFSAALCHREPGSGAPVGPVGSAGGSSTAYANHAAGSKGEFSQQQRDFLLQRQLLNQHVDMSQSHHLASNEGAKPSTHDFLSLYNTAASQYAEQGSSRGLSSSLTTQDFLQPLERGGGRAAHREGQNLRSDKHARGEGLSHAPTPPVEVERLLPYYPTLGRANGILELPPNSLVRIVGEASVEGIRSRAFSTPVGSREEHPGTDSSRGVEVTMDPHAANARETLAYWSNMRVKFGLPQDLTYAASNASSQPVLENGQQPTPISLKQWPQVNQGLIDTTKRSARVPSEDDEDEDEDYHETGRDQRKDIPFQKGDVSQKMDTKNSDIRGGTPRSKHSATEQRRRSKINDRFQMLRELVPHSDQKRDKASFLLEVIEYIQVLQDKVHKYETAEHGRHQERLKNMVWDLCKRGTGAGEEGPRIDTLVFGKEYGQSVAAGVPMDVKQIKEAAGTIMRSQVTIPSACGDESATTPTEVLSSGAHNVQHVNRPSSSVHSCVSSHDEKENAAAMAKPVPATVSPQRPVASTFGRLAIQTKQQHPSIDVQHQQPSGEGPFLKFTHENEEAGEAEAPKPARSRLNGQHLGQAQVDSQEKMQLDLRVWQAPPCQSEQCNGQPRLAKVETPQAKPHTGSDALVGVGSSRESQNSLQPHSDVTGRSSPQQQLGVPSCEHSPQKDGSAAASTAQEPMSIQGGVINVSSVYSQGLLDTLTRALQSSGLDLTQANISVQIDLGKNTVVSAADTSAKVRTTPESSAQSHQSQGPTRPAVSALEAERPLKRPKVETEQ